MFVWLLLAGLGYCLVTMVLYVASRWLDDQRQRHDLVVQCQQRRLQKHEVARQQQQQQST